MIGWFELPVGRHRVFNRVVIFNCTVLALGLVRTSVCVNVAGDAVPLLQARGQQSLIIPD